LTSSNNITLIERSAPVAAFTVSEIIGIGAMGHGENWTLAAGMFNDDPGTNSTDDEAWYGSVRGTIAPVNRDEATVHLGASAGYRKPDQASDMFDFDSRAENALQAVDSVSANFANADGAALYGAEAAVTYGPFHAQAEYFIVDVSRHSGSDDLEFDGGYVQVGYVLTGEHRAYKNEDGVLGGIKPERPLDPQAGDWGAWEIAGRYSTVDVSDGSVLGGEMDVYTAGLNWYLNNYARLMANYSVVDTDQNAVTPDDDPQIFLLRTQVAF
jgi:phosphate-selective porin OprO/OprP